MTIHILSLKKSLYIELMNDMAAFRIRGCLKTIVNGSEFA